MSFRSPLPSQASGNLLAPEFDPRTGARQIGSREITATPGGQDSPVHIVAWAIGFDGRAGAVVRYADTKTILETVGGDGLVAIRLTGIIGDRFGSMSERSDLIGESSVTWISAVQATPDHRGAVLTAHNDAMVQIVSVLPYPQMVEVRPTYLLEAIATAMEQRSPARFSSGEPDRAAIMDRLPSLDDLPLVLKSGTIIRENYVLNS